MQTVKTEHLVLCNPGDVYNAPVKKLDIDDPKFCGRPNQEKVNPTAYMCGANLW